MCVWGYVQTQRLQNNNSSTCTATTRMDKNASSPRRDSISWQTLFTMPNLSAKSWKLWTLLQTHPLFAGHMHRNLYSVTCQDMSELIHTWRLWTTTTDFSLPLHASTKTRRLRAVAAFLFWHSWGHIASVEIAQGTSAWDYLVQVG